MLNRNWTETKQTAGLIVLFVASIALAIFAVRFTDWFTGVVPSQVALACAAFGFLVAGIGALFAQRLSPLTLREPVLFTRKGAVLFAIFGFVVGSAVFITHKEEADWLNVVGFTFFALVIALDKAYIKRRQSQRPNA